MPSLPPSGLANCNIIDLSYTIQVTADFELTNYLFDTAWVQICVPLVAHNFFWDHF